MIVIKTFELADPLSCLNKSQPDEPIFVLCGRDRTASVAIRMWCELRILRNLNRVEDAQIVEAIHLARQMEIWRAR